MKLRKNKKGFTIVELVIVIGVIGILSAILIPTFVNLTDNANKAAAKQEVSDAYSLFLQDAVDGRLGEEYDTVNKKGVPAPKSSLQSEVRVLRKDQYFAYTTEEGWKGLDNSVDDMSAYTLLAYNGNPAGETNKLVYNNCTIYVLTANYVAPAA